MRISARRAQRRRLPLHAPPDRRIRAAAARCARARRCEYLCARVAGRARQVPPRSPAFERSRPLGRGRFPPLQASQNVRSAATAPSFITSDRGHARPSSPASPRRPRRPRRRPRAPTPRRHDPETHPAHGQHRHRRAAPRRTVRDREPGAELGIVVGEQVRVVLAVSLAGASDIMSPGITRSRSCSTRFAPECVDLATRSVRVLLL